MHFIKKKKKSLMILKSLIDQRFITQDTCLNFYIYVFFPSLTDFRIVRKRTDVRFKKIFCCCNVFPRIKKHEFISLKIKYSTSF